MLVFAKKTCKLSQNMFSEFPFNNIVQISPKILYPDTWYYFDLNLFLWSRKFHENVGNFICSVLNFCDNFMECKLVEKVNNSLL